MARRIERIGRSGCKPLGAALWLGAWISLWMGLPATAQNTYLPANLTSGTYQAAGALTNCTGLGPPPTGCTSVTLNTNAQATLEAGTSIVLGPGFTANAANPSTSLVALIGASAYVPITVTTAPVTSLQVTVDGTPCASPCNFQWLVGSPHTIATASPQSGGSGVQYAYASWSDGGAQSHSITVPSSAKTYTANFTEQYYLTTTASTGGSISPSSGWESSGAVVPVNATSNSGYVFQGFSGALTGTTTPQNLTVTGPESVNASFASTAPLTLPGNLKGLGEYFPRGHAWWSMLYDWYTEDCAWSTTGPQCGQPNANTNTVAQMVAADLQTLHANGINFIHLYLWDQDIAQSVLMPRWQANHVYALDDEIRDPSGHTQKVTTAAPDGVGTSGSSQPTWSDTGGTTADGTLLVWTDQGPLVSAGLAAPGFVGWDDGGPEASPGNTAGPGNPNPPAGCPSPCNQWSALQAFLSLAQQYDIWVSLEFAVNRPDVEVGSPPSGMGYSYESVGSAYGTWVSRFIEGLQAYQKVLIWGIDYGLQGPLPNSAWNTFWAGGSGYLGAYPEILAALQSYSYASPAGRALLMVDSGFGQDAPKAYNPSQPNPYDQNNPIPVTSWGFPVGPYYNTPTVGALCGARGTERCVLPIMSGMPWGPWPDGDLNLQPPLPACNNVGAPQCDSGTGYQWEWQQAQLWASYWPTLVTWADQQGNHAANPDVYAIGLYNASAADLEAALECVSGTVVNGICNATPYVACGSGYNQNCPPIPYSQMLVTEVATGSSFEQPSTGNGNALAAYGDAQTPTSGTAGQAQWLTDTLCVINSLNTNNSANIPATGWYGLYDSASWWEQNLNYSGAQLAWNGYWGLINEGGSQKPAWSAFAGYPGNCPSDMLPPTPVLALYPDAGYYTTGNPATITYGAADVTSLSLTSPSTGGIYSCGSADEISTGTTLLGSCAATAITVAGSPQQQTVTLNGSNTDVAGNTNNQAVPNSASTVLNVQPSPQFTGATNYNNTAQQCNFVQSPSCVITACQGDYVEIFGQGFDPLGGNTVNLVAGGNSLWLYTGDGWGFWDGSRTQINAQVPISSAFAPGTWQFDVWTPGQQSPSSAYSINIVSNSNCQWQP